MRLKLRQLLRVGFVEAYGRARELRELTLRFVEESTIPLALWLSVAGDVLDATMCIVANYGLGNNIKRYRAVNKLLPDFPAQHFTYSRVFPAEVSTIR